MKSPTELNFANGLTSMFKSASENGVDVQNVLETMLTKFKDGDKKREVFRPREHIGETILFNTSFEYYIKEGKILNVSSKGFIEIEVITKQGEFQTKLASWFDPSTVYVHEVLKNDVPEK